MTAVEQADYLILRHPSGNLEIRISTAILSGLSKDAMRGFGVTRRRGTETGGLLLGRWKPGATPVLWLEGYEEVPCEYAEGPSYLLSEADRARFREAVERNEGQVAGFYRSHTRDGMQMDAADAALCAGAFRQPYQVALLVKPFATKPPAAAVFGQQSGVLNTEEPLFPEFPFVKPGSETRQASAPVTLAPVERPAAVLPAPAPERQALSILSSPPTQGVRTEEPAAATPWTTPRPAAAAQPAATWRRLALWGALVVATLGFGALLGYEYARFEAAQTAASQAAANPYSVGLQVSLQDNDLLVQWQKDAPPAQFAQRGVLRITEAGASKEVQLGYAEIRNGTILYHHTTPEAAFRLELFSADEKSFSEAVTWRSATGQAVRD